MKPPAENVETLLKDWLRRTREAQGVHYETAKQLSKRNLWFGIPVVVLSSLVGTSVFASLAKNPGVAITILVGLLSVTVVVFSSLQTFLNFSERAEKHRSVGAKYGSIRRELEEIIATKILEGDECKTTLEGLRRRIDALAAEAPPTSAQLFNEVVRHLDATPNSQ